VRGFRLLVGVLCGSYVAFQSTDVDDDDDDDANYEKRHKALNFGQKARREEAACSI